MRLQQTGGGFRSSIEKPRESIAGLRMIPKPLNPKTLSPKPAPSMNALTVWFGVQAPESNGVNVSVFRHNNHPRLLGFRI